MKAAKSPGEDIGAKEERKRMIKKINGRALSVIPVIKTWLMFLIAVLKTFIEISVREMERSQK